MTIKIFDSKSINCGTAFLLHSNSDVEIHSPEIRNCGIGFAQYTSKVELELLLQKSKEHLKEIIALTEKVKETKPELRKSVITASAVFSALAVGSNASTVFEFLIDHFPALAKLLS